MATHTPARIAGVDSHKGSIVPGGDADLIALDEQGYVKRTWVRGRTVYEDASRDGGRKAM